MIKSVKENRQYFTDRSLTFCLIVVACFYADVALADGAAVVGGVASADGKDSGRVCKTITDEDKKTTTFCVFSLNNPKEYHALGKKYAKTIKDENGTIIEYEKDGVKIREFYGAGSKGGSVRKNYKKMLRKSECDSVVASGHHTGYFAGEQSIDKHSDSQTLDLDFMEEMSCEEGCEDWFSNVKSLFLMGCNTVKTPENLAEGKVADYESIRISSKDKVGSNYIHDMVNQAYSSTLDQNNKLSHRYLRMFPNSSLYGWGAKAPSVGSKDSLPNFISLIAKLQREESGGNSSSGTDDILNFIGFMNNQTLVEKCAVATHWARHWVSKNPKYTDAAIFKRTQATACYLKDQTSEDQFKAYHRLGCDLTKAVKSDNADEIKKAIDSILGSGSDGIKANFNRLMSLVISRKNKKKGWYEGVVEQLKNNTDLKSTLMAGIKSDKVGFTRKSDYLYFYRKMGWQDAAEDKKISAAFLKQLQKAFTDMQKKRKNSNPSVTKSFHLSLLNSIEDNNLQKWLYENGSKEFDDLFKQYSDAYSASEDKGGNTLEYYINDTVKYLKESIDKG